MTRDKLLKEKLTKDFTLGEFFVSKTDPQLVDQIEITDEIINKLYWLCLFALQPIRDMFGVTQILSGVRSLELNRLVKGSKTSQHLKIRLS